MTTVYSRLKDLRKYAIAIASGAAISDIVDTTSGCPIAVLVPVAQTNATMNVLGSIDGTNFFQLRDSAGTAITISTTATGLVKLPPATYDGIPWIRFEGAGNEAAARYLTVLIADYR